MRIPALCATGVVALLAAVGPAFAGSPVAAAASLPPVGTSSADDATVVPLIEELGVRFPKSRSWFGQVADMVIRADAAGTLRPDYATAVSSRIIRHDSAGQRLLSEAPPRADGSFRIALEGDPGLWVVTRSLDAEPVEARVARGLVVYPGAMPQGDLLFKFTPTHTDEYVYMREPSDTATFRHSFAVGPHVSGLLETPRGIVVLDQDGVPRLRLNRPFVWDATGARRDGTVRIDGNEIVAELDLTGLTFPVLIDPDWQTTGLMNGERFLYSLMPLPDGSALAAGGCRYGNCPSAVAHPNCSTLLTGADRFDPLTRTWSPVAPMAEARYAYGAAVLPGGEILVAGGCQGSACSLQIAGAEIFDPTSETWSPAGALSSPRAYAVGVTLASGEVLFVGGCNATECATDTDLYDPVTGTWSTRAGLLTPRAMHTVTLLADGRILVVGGCSQLDCAGVLATTEIYDPGLDMWMFSVTMDESRYGHTATGLCDDSVVIIGGCSDLDCLAPSGTVARWIAGAFYSFPSMQVPRHHHTTSLMPDGRLLVAGGCLAAPSFVVCTEAAEVFEPSTCTWEGLDPLPVYLGSGRGYHQSLRLPTGEVVVAGGCNSSTCLADVDLYEGVAGDVCAGSPVVDCGKIPPPPSDAGVDPGSDGAVPGIDAGDISGTDGGLVILPPPRCNCRVGSRAAPGTTMSGFVLLALLLGRALGVRRCRRRR